MRLRPYVAILVLVAFNHPVLGQETTGGISGAVRDETGGVLPGVALTVKHLDTAMTRAVVTDDQGHYRAANLGLGGYEITAALSGFQTEVRRGILITIGREAIIDFTMKVGDLAESVIVTGEAALVDTTGSSVSGVVADKAISDLPLSGRDFVQLALLEPSVLRVTNTDSVISKGFGTRTTFAGSRPRQNTFLMDGTNVNNFTNFAVPGSVAGVVLGVDTVREFQVLVGSYSAEYAGAGGTLSAVTRSGTNTLHGTAFWFNRNDRLDARNFFDRKKPDFMRNQFGFTAGGPIRRDRLFFFGSYEGLRDRLGVTNIGTVPDANARNGLLPDPQNPGRLINVGIDPRIAPYLALNPLPNSRVFGDGRGEYVWSATEPTNQRYFVGKVDYNYGASNSLFGRFTFDDSDTLKAKTLPLFSQLWTNRSQWLTVENRTVASARTLFVLRYGFTRSNVFGDDVVSEGQSFDPALSLVPGLPFGSVSFVPSRDNRSPRSNITNSHQLTAQMVFERGRHSLKAGAEVIRYLFEINNVFQQAGGYTFQSLEDLLRNRPFRLTIGVYDTGTIRRIRQTVAGFFIQDSLRLTPRFTLNAGLRYEPYGVPREIDGLESTLKHPMDAAYTVGSPIYANPSRRNLAPRIGFAWDATGNGRFALRGGGGVYHDILLPFIYRNGFSTSPPFAEVRTVNRPTSFPNALADLRLPGTPSLVNPDTIEFDVSQPRVFQYNLQLDTQLTSTLLVSLGYVGSRGQNQVRLTDAHTVVPDILPDGRKFFPTGRPARNPNFAGSWYRVTDGQSFYNGLRLKVNKRFSDGVLFGVAYSLGRAIDDSSTDVGQTDFQGVSMPQDNDDRKSERALANFDVRQTLSAHVAAEIPWGNRLSGVGRALLGGWQVSGIASLSSGSPFTTSIGFDNANVRSRAFTQRPNLVPGYSNNPVLGGPDLYFDPAAFELAPPGFLGNVGRNTIIAPGLALVDFSLMKYFMLPNARRLEFRAEAFNVFNRSNFGRPAAVVFDRVGRLGDAGRITNTSTPARQVQLGVKFIF